MPENLTIIKSSGKEQLFSQEKIVQSVQRAGIDKGAAEKISQNIAKRVYANIPSANIHNLVLEELEKHNRTSRFIYDLRRAVAMMDPRNFEVYIKKVLEAYGYSCRWDVLIMGASVEHQIDIVAEKGNEKFLVECKHHYDYHKMSGLGCVLQVQARLEDVRDGFRQGKNIHNFSQSWLVNNTLFSEHARVYASAKNIRLSGWHYQGAESLESLIESLRVYPAAILGINQYLENRLAAIGVFTVQDLLDSAKRPESVLGAAAAQKMIDDAKDILAYKKSRF